MIQFLISIIEWFAIVALSSIGIEADAVSGCVSGQSAQPAEYREAVMWVGAVDVKAARTNLMSDPCQQWLPIGDPREVPELLAPPLVYAS
ncbi:hypothetical protein [Maricaulis sp.]|uniref:hypothetical protein n=1 Tax=Maricaulis sp. TaxID=1486257 RepID=UPI002B272943|nr:hypothetical protein [Maricaulis sp.]